MPSNEIDEYIKNFPPDTQKVLQKIRQTVNKAAPGCEESITYGIPTLKYKGKYVIYFAGFKNHVSVYPVHFSFDDKTLQKELKPYLSGKGTAKFPLDNPVPYDLIAKVTRHMFERRKA